MRQVLKNKEIGHIMSFYSGVAKIQGLPHVFLYEVLLDRDGTEVAIVIGFDEYSVEALFFNESFNLEKPVFRSSHAFSIAVSDTLTGRVVNGFGKPIDRFGGIKGKNTKVFRQAPQIIERSPVSVPLSTGIKIIDTNLTLGRGQRELIIGDRKLGKSTIAIDIILNQKHAEIPVRCIYVICGQKKQKLDELISILLATTIIGELPPVTIISLTQSRTCFSVPLSLRAPSSKI